ncbi:uncharacterized protein [Marmota flaviventris]|uniref:uncharacterized protein isoform X2 n=1 Tax=Marmota flaviventris TaxID=93162 RepID=UPI003A86C43D
MKDPQQAPLGPTWDDCQQLLGTLFMTEERERILLEARKNILGPDGRPTQLPNIIEADIPLNRPNWDPNSFEGKHLRGTRPGQFWEMDFTEIKPTRLKVLERTQRYLWKQLATAYQPGDEGTPHRYQVGDFIYIRRHQVSSLEPHWKGPYQVLIITPTAVKVDGITSWIHASHLKPVPCPDSGWKLEKTDNGNKHYGCRDTQARCRLASLDYYVCPEDYRSHKESRLCGGETNFFCTFTRNKAEHAHREVIECVKFNEASTNPVGFPPPF